MPYNSPWICSTGVETSRFARDGLFWNYTDSASPYYFPPYIDIGLWSGSEVERAPVLLLGLLHMLALPSNLARATSGLQRPYQITNGRVSSTLIRN